MWTLFVLSLVPDFGEVKLTRYETYVNAWQCGIAKEELEKEFESGEKAICMQTDRPIPDLDVLY